MKTIPPEVTDILNTLPNDQIIKSEWFIQILELSKDGEIEEADRIVIARKVWECFESEIHKTKKKLEYLQDECRKAENRYLDIRSKQRVNENYEALKDMVSKDLGVTPEQLLALLQSKLDKRKE